MATSMRVCPTALVNVSSNTDTTLVNGIKGGKVRVLQVVLQNTHATTDCSVTFKTSTGTAAISGTHLLKAAGGSLVLPYSELAYFNTLSDDDLILTTSASATITGTVNYERGQ